MATYQDNIKKTNKVYISLTFLYKEVCYVLGDPDGALGVVEGDGQVPDEGVLLRVPLTPIKRELHG